MHYFVRFLVIGLVFASMTASTALAEMYEVSQKGRKFHPGKLSIKVGDEVKFINSDRIVHNVFSRSKAKRFDIDAQRPGETSSIVFDKPGTVLIRCAIHPKMQMKIRVTE